MKKVINLLSIALIALAFAACSSSNTPEGAMKNYLKAVQNNDAKAVVDMFYFSKQLTQEEHDQYVQMFAEKLTKQNEKKQGVSSYEIGEVVMAEDGNSAVVNYTVHYGDGSEQSDKQKLVLVDGKWLLDSGK